MSSPRTVVIELGEQWVVEMTWPDGVTDGGPSALTLRPADPENPPEDGISPMLLREISFSEARARLRSQGAPVPDVSDALLRRFLAAGVSPTYLALLASRYVRVTNEGQAHPQEVLAEVIRKTPSTVKGHLWQARKAGLLAGSAGRAGGTLTAEARRLIQEAFSG